MTRQSEYYSTHRKERAEYQCDYYRKHRKEIAVRIAKYYQRHRKELVVKQRDYRRRNPEARQARDSRTCLRKALLILTLRHGWPDAENIEQKIGSDYVLSNQWIRAAWFESRRKIHPAIVLFFAKTHDDAVRKIGRRISFKDYARELGCSNEWQKLVEKWA